MFNFCIAMNIYTNSQIEGDVRSVREFHNWLLIEILTTMSTILGAIVFLSQRWWLGKPYIELSPDDD